ncbi:deoxyUTP pyrophosphatase [Syntrophobotulus glycolicus DSM 8271]|uniref:dUTP diphosphatase n=1 Tax=Syntrophobotulus glycolicus (strain DSM 8271 / FlGlyR) TaxID=645991 RepID=F0SU07_SYNGF|nr:dUTP pyrophosphatase [Syntrophobotulus glycolicus]ADY56530.1 deoxyUTP pyrophosphatase [Syntrophobotulus glycolicus DSM 8271]
MRRFLKVSYEQYRKDSDDGEENGELSKEYEDIILPRRATRCSAGYDFYAPRAFALEPGGQIKLATGIRAIMNEDEWLGLYIRSGHGFKFGVRLKNSVAVIDADYANALNEGHIQIAIYNGGDKLLRVEKGEAFAQGVFQKYLLTEDDNPRQSERLGGMGSTSSGN